MKTSQVPDRIKGKGPNYSQSKEGVTLVNYSRNTRKVIKLKYEVTFCGPYSANMRIKIESITLRLK